MLDKVTYLETGSVSPYYNLAFEEYVLSRRTDGDYLMLWQNDNTIVIGQNQNTAQEINSAFVEQHGIHVVRRATGGGAVYHDMGNLNYSFITDLGNAAEVSISRFTAPVVAALRSMGLEAEASGRNDILVSGCKVSGTAQRVVKNRILHHGTLLFDSDPDMVAGALNVDPEKFRSKSSRSVRSRIGNIRQFLPQDMTLGEFWNCLKEKLAGAGFTEDRLQAEELEEVLRLEKEKYATWEWNYGHSPAYDMKNKKYFDAGILEVQMSAKNAVITEIRFYGDFLSVRPLEELTEALRGIPADREAVAAVLDTQPVREFFGGITKEEVLSTIFDV